jgi:NADPH:quinone reductase-like Zn-dependent oxidoreductase
MKAVVFEMKEEGPMIKDVSVPEPAKEQVLVQRHYAALNHLDLWIWKGQTLDKEVTSGCDSRGIVGETEH